MKKALILLVVFCFSSVALAQVNFTAIPRKLQLYSRNAPSDTGKVIISGTVNSAGFNYSGMRVKVYRNNSLFTTLNQNLTFGGGSAPFSFAYAIKAELAQYKFEALGVNGSSETLLRSADSVLCGDVYIITGQSNAEAHRFAGSASANNSQYIRVFGYAGSGSDTLWRVGQGDGNGDSPGNTGQWGLRMARLIIDNHGIPVAIFNGCQSGQPISTFKRNNNTPTDLNTNYGRLLTRLKKTGLTSGITALFWFQGEQDANDATSMADYMTAFTTLRSGWLSDYPSIKKIYVFQIGSYCINSGVPVETFPDYVNQIKEAHRRLGEEVPDLQTMSSSGADHYNDGSTYCHYPYTKGYELFGNNAYWLLARDFYGKTADNIDAPSIKFAEVSGLSEITLIMKNIMDSITWNSGSETNFQIEGTTAKVVTGKTIWNRIVLTLSGTPAGATGISYRGTHDWHADPIVRNRNGIGAVHFYKFPLTSAKHRDSACVAAILKANGSALPVDSAAVYSGQRITALRLSGKKISVIPADIGYMDSLKTIDLTANLLTTLPLEITKISLANVMVNSNRMCSSTISDTIKTWVNRYSRDVNWQATQLADSLHLCDGTLAEEFRSSEEMAAYSNSQRFMASVRGKYLLLSIARPEEVTSIKVIKINGSVVSQFDHASNIVKIDLGNLSTSSLIVQVKRGYRMQSTKRILLF
jgi:Leucine-rich repeat (LRR) protein